MVGGGFGHVGFVAVGGGGGDDDDSRGTAVIGVGAPADSGSGISIDTDVCPGTVVGRAGESESMRVDPDIARKVFGLFFPSQIWVWG